MNSPLNTGVCEKNSSGEEDPRENQLEQLRIGGWRGVSAAALQGDGSCKRNVFVTDTGISEGGSSCNIIIIIIIIIKMIIIIVIIIITVIISINTM